MKIYKLSILTLFFFLSYSILLSTEGKLTVKTSTSTTNGQYSPRNIVAIWIEDASGKFVKTLLVYSKFYTTYLNTWQASTKKAGVEFNSVDAITGATQTAYGNLECYWNGKDYKGLESPDGKYKVWLELTDKNATGNFTSFEFTKGNNLSKATTNNVPSFSSNSIVWEPGSSSVNDEEYNFSVYPNPTSDIIHISGSKFDYIQILDINGKSLYVGKAKTLDLSSFAKSTYFLEIFVNDKRIVKKIIKK